MVGTQYLADAITFAYLNKDQDVLENFTKSILTQSNNKIEAQYLLNKVNTKEYDFLVLPGGKAVFNILDKEQRIDQLVDEFYNSKKLICAICAAPRLIAKRGYFNKLKFTIFPGCLDGEVLGKEVDKGVVVEEQFITAKSMYYTIEFALEIVNKLQGKEQKIKIEKQLQGK